MERDPADRPLELEALRARPHLDGQGALAGVAHPHRGAVADRQIALPQPGAGVELRRQLVDQEGPLSLEGVRVDGSGLAAATGVLVGRRRRQRLDAARRLLGASRDAAHAAAVHEPDVRG